MAFAAGTFPFPTSTGTFSVTGVGFEPKMVVMFGGNQATEDTHLTGLTRPGVFLSVSSFDYFDFNINTWCLSVAGNTSGGGTTMGYTRFSGHTGNTPIRMQATTGAANIDYRANGITFDADGFTLTVSHAAPANRPIHWWAVDGEIASWFDANTTGTFPGDFPIRSFLGLAGPVGGGDPNENFSTTDAWLFFGTQHWPKNAESLATRYSALTHTGLNTVGAGGRQGWTEQPAYNGTNAERLVFDLGTAGPAFQESYTTSEPDVLFGTDAVVAAGDTDQTDYTNVVWMGYDGMANGLTTDPDVGDSISVSTPSWFNQFALVMFTTINGPDAVGTGVGPEGEIRYGIGVLHPDYQGCVVMGSGGSFYQSTTKCMAGHDATNLSVVEGTILGDTFELETVQNGYGSFTANYHAFGPEIRFVPDIYRRRIA